MTKKLTATKMPQLRATLQEQYDKFSPEAWQQQIATFTPSEIPTAKKTKAFNPADSTLWWVRPDMARLAWDASQTLPDNTRLLETVPAPKGILVWEGDPLVSGVLVTSRYSDEHRTAPIHGVTWEVTARGVEVGTLIYDPPGADELSHMPYLTYLYIGQLKKDLEAYLTATFLLATQPRIGQITCHDPAPRRRRHTPPNPGDITTGVNLVALRENAARLPTEEPSEGEKKWGLSVRFMVRGHWRNQACGEKLGQRRPVYVAPYLKGPEDAPLKSSETVFVWRR